MRCQDIITKIETSCKPPGQESHPVKLEAVVQAYLESCQARLEAQLRSFTEEPTIQAAVARAAVAQTPERKRYSHQRRIKAMVLETVRHRLLELDLGEIRSFAELHTAVDHSIGSIRGVGELLVYDTALRIGAKLRVMPDCVYLHSGARQGARALGLLWKQRSLSIAELPIALRSLKPHHIENCLCIFKDRF